MSENEYYGKIYSDNTMNLIERLKKISDEYDFIIGVISNAKNEDDRKAIINFIDKGNDVTHDNILLLGLSVKMC